MSTSVDFESLYQGDLPDQGVMGQDGTIPWDIGEPQPVLVELDKAGQLTSEILDAGCGLGDNSLFLARNDYRVTGFDVSPTAIERARQRAADAKAEPQFSVEDATRLDGLEQRFSTILDSALYHCLDDQQRAEYAAALHRVTLPNAALHLFCVADVESAGLRMPIVVAPDNLRTNLGQYWDIQDISLTRYTSAFTRETLQQLNPETTREMGFEVNVDDAQVDDSDRVLLPVWHLRAIRR